MNYETLTEDLGAVADAAEVHGFITGWIAAGADVTEMGRQDDPLLASLADYLDVSFGEYQFDVLQDVTHLTLEQIDAEDLSFAPWQPDDETGINKRRGAVSAWSQGFISGFGRSGLHQQSELSEEVLELLEDFVKVSMTNEQLEADEENEADLFEIVEYVKMGALYMRGEFREKFQNKMVH